MSRHAPWTSLTIVSSHTHRARGARETSWTRQPDRARLSTVPPLSLRAWLTIASRSSRSSRSSHWTCRARLSCPTCHALETGQPVRARKSNGPRPSWKSHGPCRGLLLAQPLKFSSQTRVSAIAMRILKNKIICRLYGFCVFWLGVSSKTVQAKIYKMEGKEGSEQGYAFLISQMRKALQRLRRLGPPRTKTRTFF